MAPSSEDVSPASSTPSLPASSLNPPTICILPRNRSLDNRILSLPDPATGKQIRYFFDSKLGLHEFSSISNPISTPSSWLLSPELRTTTADNSEDDHALTKGYTIEQPNLLMATPIDILCMILPTLLVDAESSNRKLFLTIEDHVEKTAIQSKDLAEILRHPSMIALLENRMTVVCDKIEAGDESMFRLNTTKLTKYLLSKADKMVSSGLPPSMEQKFIQEPLQAPMSLAETTATSESTAAPPHADASSQEPTASFASVDSNDDLISTMSSQTNVQDSQSSLSSITTAATSISSVSVPAESTAPQGVQRLMRLRVSLNFILASYISPPHHASIKSMLNDPSVGTDFSQLDVYLTQIDELKKEAQALRSLSDNISRKRRNEDDDEAEELRAEKRRKKEEDDAKKKAQNRAIKQLSKADTSGMKKLSSFFTKAPVKKAA